MPVPELIPWSDQRTPALAIVARGDQIRTISPTQYEVKSQSRPGRRYTISIRKDRWNCSCYFHRGTRLPCIHIRAIQHSERLQVSPDDGSRPKECSECGSPNLIGFGRRHNRSGVVRRFLCRACGTRFTHREGELRLRHQARAVALALDLYFRGLSLRKVSDHLHQAHGFSVAPTTIYNWISRFSPRAAKWMDSLGARTGERWHVDETVIKSDGAPWWVWNIEDADTRFLLATHVTKLRRVRDARAVLRRAKQASPDRPIVVFSDGLSAYRKAIGRELAFRSGAEVVNPHEPVPSIRAKRSNNLVERLHGTEKERIKVMRGFHGRKGPKILMEGFRVYYNMVRDHSAIHTTPAVAASLPDPGGFRWKEIVQQSSRRVPRGQVEIDFIVG